MMSNSGTKHAAARRFFRFFGFIESFQRVSALLGKGGIGSVPAWLDLAKWTCFGLYFVLEDLTMVCISFLFFSFLFRFPFRG